MMIHIMLFHYGFYKNLMSVHLNLYNIYFHTAINNYLLFALSIVMSIVF